MDIDRNSILKQFSEPEEKLLFSKVINQAYLCYRNNSPFFSDFWDPLRLSKFSKALAEFNRHIDILSYGGFLETERRMMGFFPKHEGKEEDFPIDGLLISFDKKFGSPSHRDVLGAIIGLGIDRRVLGDILPCDGFFIAFAERQIASYIEANLEKAGRITVKCKKSEYGSLPVVIEKKAEKNITVPSMRLDSVISEALNLSRSESAEHIKKERVFLNWIAASSGSKTVNCGDNITVRGLGRFKIIEITGQTKKGRIGLRVELYK